MFMFNPIISPLCRNIMCYNGRKDYNMLTIGAWFFFQGKFVSFAAFMKTYLPFLLIVLIITFLSSLL